MNPSITAVPEISAAISASICDGPIHGLLTWPRPNPLQWKYTLKEYLYATDMLMLSFMSFT